MTIMHSDLYHEGYWERGEGSNYVAYGDDPGWEATVAALVGVRGPYGRWLEVACAKGYFVRAARRHGMDVHGVDISEYAISQAPAEVRPYVSVMSALDLHEIPSGSMDVVCSWEFLEHVPDEDTMGVFDELARVLTPQGLMVHRIGIDTTDDPRFPAGAGHNHQQDVTHFNERPDAWWRQFFSEQGMVQVDAVEDALNRAFEGRDWQDRFYAYRWL